MRVAELVGCDLRLQDERDELAWTLRNAEGPHSYRVLGLAIGGRDHTAIIKFVESRFIGTAAHLTARDAAQPNLLDFFDFTNAPWATPPTPPVAASNATFGRNTCTPATM